MVFEGSNGAFGRVATVVVRWDKLVGNVEFVFENVFDGGGCFVV